MERCINGHIEIYHFGFGLPCPLCKERDRADAAEAKVVELRGTIDTMQAKLDDARINA